MGDKEGYAVPGCLVLLRASRIFDETYMTGLSSCSFAARVCLHAESRHRKQIPVSKKQPSCVSCYLLSLRGHRDLPKGKTSTCTISLLFAVRTRPSSRRLTPPGKPAQISGCFLEFLQPAEDLFGIFNQHEHESSRPWQTCESGEDASPQNILSTPHFATKEFMPSPDSRSMIHLFTVSRLDCHLTAQINALTLRLFMHFVHKSFSSLSSIAQTQQQKSAAFASQRFSRFHAYSIFVADPLAESVAHANMHPSKANPRAWVRSSALVLSKKISSLLLLLCLPLAVPLALLGIRESQIPH